MDILLRYLACRLFRAVTVQRMSFKKDNSKKRPIQQTIGTWFNGKSVILDLKGTPFLENLETKDELAAAFTVEIGQAE